MALEICFGLREINKTFLNEAFVFYQRKLSRLFVRHSIQQVQQVLLARATSSLKRFY